MIAAGKNIPLIGLAKKEELIYFPGEQQPLRIDHRDKGLQLLMRVRGESHRFALRYHRFLRAKGIEK
jgi:excinuclease ABC subunit C